MSVTTISPKEAHRLADAGATLIDIREAGEHGRERIAGALNLPIDKITPGAIDGDRLIFHCRSGMRTGLAAEHLARAAGARECYILEGGIEGWRGAGLETERTSGAPVEMQRQVVIAAGSLVLIGTLLSLVASPGFIAVPLLVGAGLIFAGISGFCGIAQLLALAPWNRIAASNGN